MISISLTISIILAVIVVVHTREARIVGGAPIDITAAPFQVSLQWKNKHQCGGSIISSRHILTAAQCTKDDHYVERYMVRVGSSKHGSGGLLKEVKRIVAHKEFNTVKYNYDLAVLELISDIRFDNTKRPINLPNQGQQLPDKVILDISGWGLTKNHNETRDHLRRVSLVLVNKNDCEKVYNPDYFSPNITDQMLCATSPGKDKCDGDSGGPLNKNNTLFGVASWGGGEGCGKAGYPGVYSKVAAAVDWIRGVMNGTIS